MTGVRQIYLALALTLLAVSLGTVALASFPSPQGWVTDLAGVLEESQRAQLENLLGDLERETSAEIALVVVSTTAPLDPFTYGVRLFEEWGIGKEGVDNGLLILLAMEEREIRVEVGYGLEHVLTDGHIGSLLDSQALPHFREDRFGAGLVELAQALALDIRKAHASGDLERREGDPAGEKGISSDALMVVGFLAFWVLIAIVIMLINRARTRCPRCRARLRVSSRTIARPGIASWGTMAYIYSCLACGLQRETTRRIPPTGSGVGGMGRGGGFGRSGGGRTGGFGGFGGGRSGGGGAGRRF